MPTINLTKVRQEIRLDDDPDSPVFILDLSDAAINQQSTRLAGCYILYERTMEALEKGEITPDEYHVQLAGIFKQVIVTMLGEDAYDTIYAYVADGTDLKPYEVTYAMTPVAKYLLEQFDQVISVNRTRTAERYLDGVDGTDAL